MISNLGKDISDSASCNWFNLQIRESLRFLKLKQPELNFKTPWNIPFWLLPQLCPAPCPTCLSRSSVASFCKAESLKPVMCGIHGRHDILLSFTNAFQQGRMTPVLGENALDGMPATVNLGHPSTGCSWKLRVFAMFPRWEAHWLNWWGLDKPKAEHKASASALKLLTNPQIGQGPTSLSHLCFKFVVCVHVSVMQCCCRSVKSFFKRNWNVEGLCHALSLKFLAKRLLIRWNGLWLSVLWCHSISLRGESSGISKMCACAVDNLAKDIQKWTEREEREEPMRNTAKVLLYLAFTKQWPSLRVRSTVGRESGILSYRQIFKISTAGCELRKEHSRQFSWDHEDPSFSRSGDGKCRGDCIIQILKGCSLPSRRDFWLLSAPTQSQTKWCRAIQKSQAIVLPLSFLPIEIRFEAITSTKSCLNCD